jgi:hypothetical protein
VAVLLDNFVTASTLMENEANASKLQERKALSQFQNPLQPLILRLADRFEKLATLADSDPMPTACFMLHWLKQRQLKLNLVIVLGFRLVFGIRFMGNLDSIALWNYEKKI